MGAIDDYINAKAQKSSQAAIDIYNAFVEIEKKKEEERKKFAEEQRKLNDELATVRKELGFDKEESYLKAAQDTWNGGTIKYNPETGLYEGSKGISNYFSNPSSSLLETNKPASIAKDIANIGTFGAIGNYEKSKIEEQQKGAYDDILKKLETNKEDIIKRIGAENYNALWQEANSKGTLKGDSLSGYVSDIKLGDLQVKRNSAWDRYLNSGLLSDKELAESYDKALATYSYTNPDAGKQTLSGTANYIPQAVYYAKKNIPGTVAALGAYGATRGLTGNKEAAGALAKAIYGTTQVAAGFQGTMEQTAGGEFGDMVKLGIPEDIAREAAQNSAFWQSVIEEAETAKDIYQMFQLPQQKGVTNKIKEFFKNWGMNIISEGAEEGSQSIVGFVHEKDAARRAGLDMSDYTLENMFSQAWEEAKGGAEIGATMYLAEGLPHIVIGAVTNNRNQRLAIQDAPLNSTIAVVPTNTDEYGNQTVNKEQFKKVLTQTYDEDIKKAKEIAAQGGENAALANKLVKQLEAGKERNLKEKTFNTIADGVNQSLDAQATNKTQTLTKQTQTFANDILKSEQEKARNSGFKNMEFNVADKITAGQKNLASFAKNNLGLNVVYYTTKNGKEGSKVYRHRGIWIEGDTIFVNQRLRTTKNALSVIGHEYAHDNFYRNEDVRNKVYATYSNEEAIAYGRDHGWDKPGFMSQEEINKYKEEMYADDVGEYISQQEVINQIESGNKSAAKVIKDTLANIIENTTGYRPQFDNISQYNMSGTSVLNGVELSNELKEAVDKDIENRQNKKKLSKKETSNKETKKEVSKKETAAKLTPDQKQNERWYEEQKKDNKSRDQIQKSLALRMKKAVNSTEVKAEMTRLEGKYNQTKRSAEITGTSKKENRMYDNLGNRLSGTVAKYDRNSKLRDGSGRLIYWWHTNQNKTANPFTETNPVGTAHYRYGGQITFFGSSSEKMSRSYGGRNASKVSKNRATMAYIDKFLKINKAFGNEFKLTKNKDGEYIFQDSKNNRRHVFANKEMLLRDFNNVVEFMNFIDSSDGTPEGIDNAGKNRIYGGYLNVINPYIVEQTQEDEDKGWAHLSEASPEELKRRRELSHRFTDKFGVDNDDLRNVDRDALRESEGYQELVSLFVNAINKFNRDDVENISNAVLDLISSNTYLEEFKNGLELMAKAKGQSPKERLSEHVKNTIETASVIDKSMKASLSANGSGLSDQDYFEYVAEPLIEALSDDVYDGNVSDHAIGDSYADRYTTNMVVVKTLWHNYNLNAGHLKELNKALQDLRTYGTNMIEFEEALENDDYIDYKDNNPAAKDVDVGKAYGDSVIELLSKSNDEYILAIRDVFLKNRNLINYYYEYSWRTMSGLFENPGESTPLSEFMKYANPGVQMIKAENWKSGYSFTQKDILDVGGYDGVWIKDIYDYGGKPVGKMEPADVAIAFDSSQFKLGDNKNPTSSKDIRYSAEITDDGKKKNTRAEKWKGKAKENEQKAKANKREAKGRGRALKWSWKKNEQQRKEKERWKARTKKREETIAGLKAKAKEKQRIRTLNTAKRELLDKIKRFEKSKTFKFMTDEQKKTYQETFGNIYKGGLSKKVATKQRELIKAQIAQALIDDPNIVVSQRVKNMVTSPNKVTLDAIQSIDEMNELLDAFSKITEQVQKQQQLVGLSRAKDALTEQKEFSDAVRELDNKHEGKKYALKERRAARDNNAIGKLINTLQSGASTVGEGLSRFFETALSTVETELLKAAQGNRNSKLMDLYKNLNEGVTRERAVIVRLRSILNKYLTDKEYKTLRQQLNPRTDWYDTGAEVTDTKGRKHKLIIDHGRLISLAMHSMQEQSLKHIGGAIVDILLDEDGDPNVVPAEGGGLVIPDMELAKKGQLGRAVAEGYTIKLTPEEINAIVGKKTDADGNVTFTNLTKEENDFVKGIQEFFEQTKEYTGEVYKTLKGIDLPMVENYFPLVANKSFIFRTPGDNLTAKNIAQAYGMFDKMGFVKERNPNAYNPIVLENVADVLSRMMNGVAKYYGYNIALHNNEVLLNTIDGDFSVRDALGRIAPDFIGASKGKGNYDVLTGFISGTMAHPNDIFARWRGRHAEFTLGLNPGSWVKQLLSIPTTAKYFTTKEVLGFATGGIAELYDTMKAYLESIDDFEKWKGLQNFLRNLTPDLDYRSGNFGLPDLSDVIDNKSIFAKMDILKGISRADRLGVTTVTRMFLYAELSRRNLLGDELTKIPAEEADQIFQEIGYELERFLRQTQPDYSQVYRANISRNSGAIARFITMYSTPVLQMMNNMLQSAYELDYAMKNGTAAEKAHAWNVMLKSGMGVFVASLGGVLISRAFALLFQGGKKDDDDYEFGKELVVSMLAPTLVLDDLARGFLGMTTYESQTPELIAFDALTEIGSSLHEIATGKSENSYNKWKKIATNTGLLFGIPARDIYKIGKAVLMYADSDLYYNMALRENTNAFKKWIETEGSPDTKEFYKAYTATRDKVLESKYGYHKADKEKNIKSNKKESFRKALEDVFGNDEKKINEYMTILGDYKS